MKIARILLEDGITVHARVTGEGMEILHGDTVLGLNPSGTTVRDYTLLAPVVPTAILCVGLNYRKHAEETGARIPEYPVLFFIG